jgi:hypothetical protein
VAAATEPLTNQTSGDDLKVSSINWQTGKVWEPAKKAPNDSKSSSQFVVKVQIAPGSGAGRRPHALNGALIYDETRETNFVLRATMEEEFARLEKAVEDEGIKDVSSEKGVKAYFRARYLDGRKILMIDVERSVEPPAW